MITQVFVWLIVCFGITNILVFSRLFEPFRDWLEPRSKWLRVLISCVMCCGAWVGFAMHFAFSPTFECHVAPEIVSWFLDGMFASGGCWIINTVFSSFEDD